tara:strand:- start:404 stop:1501 length:1098 start_codon:yes stop_codon:yes gene_type:complete
MKIIYDHKIFWNQKYGGISRYFVNLIKNFENLNVDYKIVSPFYKNDYLIEEIQKEKIVGKYIKKPFPKTSFLINAYNDLYFNFFIKKNKPDLIHTTYYNKLIKKKGIPLVTTVYDLIHEKNLIINNKYHFIKKEVLDITDHIICISNKTKKDLMEIYNIPNDKISVVYLGSDHLNSNKNNDNSNIKNEKPFLIFIGSRKKYKNFTSLLKCISISEKIKNNFDLIIFGGEKIDSNEKNLIKNLNLDPMHIKHKNGNDNDLVYLLRNSTCFVFPSLDEGFGLPILESMRNRCPVICSDITIFREVAGNAAEYFNPQDIDDMKNKLEETLFSNNRLEELKILGFNRSLKFSWADCATKTLEVYKKLII